MARRRNSPTQKSRLRTQRLNRRLLQESLEPRALMAAAGPRLIAVNPDAGSLFSFSDISQNRLDNAPTELTLRFDPGRTVDPLGGPDISSLVDRLSLDAGITVTYSPDSTIGDQNDQTVAPGFLGVDSQGRVVTFRFGSTLQDGFYRITVDSDLANVAGLTATPQTVDFELALGARVTSVVPQPIRRAANGTLVQNRNQIEVYFNNDDLLTASAQNPEFYRLILTGDTVRNTDDQVFLPQSVSYDPALDRAILTFSNDISRLSTGAPSAGTFRLRIGNLEPTPLPPIESGFANDPGSSYSSAADVTSLFDTGALFVVTGNGQTIVDGTAFSIQSGTGLQQLFYFDDQDKAGTPANAPPTGVAISFNSGVDQNGVVVGVPSTSAQIAAAIATAINNFPVLAITATAVGSQVTFAGDSGLTISLGAPGIQLATRGTVIRQAITNNNQRYPLQYPGAASLEGTRENRHVPSLLARADHQDGVATLYYNFAGAYGNDPQGNALTNAITPAQKQRVREAFAMLESQIGAKFVESASRGFQIVTGDMRAIDARIDTGRLGPLLATQVNDNDPTLGKLILDAGENWIDQFGLSQDPNRPSYFETALRGILNLLGVNDAFELPPGEVTAGVPVADVDDNSNSNGLDALRFNNPVEPDYPGDNETARAQNLYRPESKDIDLYRFVVQQAGTFSAETYAQRLPDGSLLDTALTLYRQNAAGSREVISRNDDAFGTDSRIELRLQPGTYFIGVSASGNESYDPGVADSGSGGTTEGEYDLRLNFRPDDKTTIRDTDGGVQGGTEFDGDGDGRPGGAYDFWFRTAPTADTVAANVPRTLIVDKAAVVSPANAGLPVGSPLNPYVSLTSALAAAKPGDIVRVVGNGGTDNLSATLNDQIAYEIGRGGVGNNPLADGSTLDVPQGVTVMMDAGAMFKLRDARIGVGSSDATVNRAGSALQVLGTPYLSDAAGAPLVDASGNRVPGWVYFTSYDDESLGRDTNTLVTVPDKGQWGGIEFQNDIDNSHRRETLERQGIFLNYVNHADMRYGGGPVVVGGTQRVIRPVQMIDARPTVSYNQITLSADAAIGASPDSFVETTFNEPAYALPASTPTSRYPFTSDYSRVGPDVEGNILVNNSLNGMFVEIVTPASSSTRALTTAGRWDDTDIVHLVSENLQIQGQPGGPVFQELAPAVNSVATTQIAGSLAAGTYRYRLTFVAANGDESPASSATIGRTLAAAGGIRLAQLPTVTSTSGYVGRNLYRSTSTGDGPWTLVAELDADATLYIDQGVTAGGLLRRDTPIVGQIARTTAIGGSLPAGTYVYRFTYVDGAGVESEASLPTPVQSITGNPTSSGAPGTGTIRLSNLPTTPAGSVLRAYRGIGTNPSSFVLAGVINPARPLSPMTARLSAQLCSIHRRRACCCNGRAAD